MSSANLREFWSWTMTLDWRWLVRPTWWYESMWSSIHDRPKRSFSFFERLNNEGTTRERLREIVEERKKRG
jgi:hypothetical protein